ncbi:M28 family metallopeptidase [Flavobacteriales bacterium]|nr:M28 family metallopeptidase [Flavobacteriales bacterium]
MKKLLLLLIPIGLFAQTTTLSEDSEKLKYTNSITADDLKAHLYVLASDSMEGRETGKRGQKMSANYIANYFKEIGIPPYKNNSYFQKFKVRIVKRYGKWKKGNNKKYLKGENIIGYIEGTDLKDELLVITAHYDHLGIKEDSLIYNGADDNGSGTSSILEIAEAFMLAKKEGNGPRRSVLIMPVSGEEKGLLGSKYYADNPIYPLENTVANLNVDMIGRIDDFHDNPNYVYLIGSDRLSTELHNISESVNDKHFNLDLDYKFNDEDDPNRYYYRSDHYNFAKNNIPVIFYFNGVHADYHQTSDTIDKIIFPKIEKISRFIFLTAWELANRDERPKLDAN